MVPDDVRALVSEVRNDPSRRAELIDLLLESAETYAGRGTTVAVRTRAHVIVAFGDVGIPVEAVPFVIEALRVETNPELVAAAAYATRGAVGPSPGIPEALLQALVNLRGGDAPTSAGMEPTALAEVLAALARLPLVPAEVIDQLVALHRECADSWSPAVDRAFSATISALRRRTSLTRLNLADVPPEPPSSSVLLNLDDVVVEDQDGDRLDLATLLAGQDTVVSFFYTRCQNPQKCSLTVTRLGALRRQLDRTGGTAVQVIAISYDPQFDRPIRLRVYGASRRFEFDERTRMLRAVAGHDRLGVGFGLRVGYNGTLVNQHAIELFLVGQDLRIARTWVRTPWNPDEVAAACVAGVSAP